MEYNCKAISIERLMASTKGFVMPLCQSCRTIDCANPIEKRQISILGIKKEIRVLARGTIINFVINCNGYVL